MDCIVLWVAKSQTQLSDFHFQGGRGKQREKQSTDYLEDGRSLVTVCSTNESENFRLLWTPISLGLQGDSIRPLNQFPLWKGSGLMSGCSTSHTFLGGLRLAEIWPSNLALVLDRLCPHFYFSNFLEHQPMKNHWFFPFLSRYVVSLILVYADGGGWVRTLTWNLSS